jgi:hypothetical protein
MNENNPILAKTLRKRPLNHCQASYRDTLIAVRDIARDLLKIDLEPTEDPWIVLMALRMYLTGFSQDHAILPVQSSPCGNNDCQKLIGDMEYARRSNDRRKYSPKPYICARCGHGGVPVVESLPYEFYIRLTGEERRGTFDIVNLPRIDGYRINTYIQYNGRTKHFRSIKTSPTGITVMDGTNMVNLKHEDLYDTLDESWWTTYIIGLQRKTPLDWELHPNWLQKGPFLTYNRVLIGGMFRGIQEKG